MTKLKNNMLIFALMNYFELFDIPVALKVDGAAIRNKYYELSRACHPDFHSQSGEAHQEDMLQKSADVNRAYKTFGSADETIKYVLTMKGLVEDQEKYALAPAFLAEVMDINEQLIELEMEPDEAGLVMAEKEANGLLNKIYEDVSVVVEGYREGITSEKELLQVKEYYYKKKYLQRILDKIAQMRNIATH